MSVHSSFEAVIGLEVHCQLSTSSKIFCGCAARMPDGRSVGEAEANSNTCPVCAGHPGTLPVLNRRAVEFAIRAGLATSCEIREQSVFARKNYFYPDLPKGYQISQYEYPICEEGRLAFETGTGRKSVRIQRIHLEEDAGKNIHHSGYSLVNLNRAGIPLIEIVSGPDIRSAEEAGAYLRALHAIVTYLGICDGNMQEGNFRCDANVSVRPAGSGELGTRAEIKNVNSFRFVERALEYEIGRQTEIIKAGGRVVQETRGYDSTRNVTVSMRSKEEAMDYRYFPDPDLITVRVDPEWIERIRGTLPELPEQRRLRFILELALPAPDAGVLTGSRPLAEFFEETVRLLQATPFSGVPGADPKSLAKLAANWITGEVLRLVNEEGIELAQAKLTPRHIADVVRLTVSREISSTGARQVIQSAWKSGRDVETLVDLEGLRQVNDLRALAPLIDRVIADFPDQATEYRAGKEKLLGFFVGQVMKLSGGKANPALIQELIRRKLLG